MRTTIQKPAGRRDRGRRERHPGPHGRATARSARSSRSSPVRARSSPTTAPDGRATSTTPGGPGRPAGLLDEAVRPRRRSRERRQPEHPLNGANHQDICGQKDVTNDAGDPPFGQIDLATALEHSVNTVYLRLACESGPKKVADPRAPRRHPRRACSRSEGSLSAQIALGSGGTRCTRSTRRPASRPSRSKGKAAKPYFVESREGRQRRDLQGEGVHHRGVLGGRGGGRDVGDGQGRHRRHRDEGASSTAARPPARRARRPATPTPGSSASPPSWRPRCGSARSRRR